MTSRTNHFNYSFDVFSPEFVISYTSKIVVSQNGSKRTDFTYSAQLVETKNLFCVLGKGREMLSGTEHRVIAESERYTYATPAEAKAALKASL